MNRVTKRIDDKHACYRICEKKCPDGITKDNPACLCTASIQAMEKLLQYEDLEEQGLLLRLPYKVGEIIYWYPSAEILPMEVASIFFNGKIKIGINYAGDNEVLKSFSTVVLDSDVGKTVFLTKEEAEAAAALREIN